ncbi:MAG: hypothetical protein H6R26_608 [Proteobacteria bacterium]|nr:hypothetical protein [Pseudomonadota bacterium]
MNEDKSDPAGTAGGLAPQPRPRRPARNAIVYNSAFAKNGPVVNASLLSFIRLIEQRHESVLRATRDPVRSDRLARSLVSLRLAQDFLEKGELNSLYPQHPPQVAVIGPTQAGKSSVTNLLIGTEVARVSPLAGFTVHPQGFALSAGDSGWADIYFGSGHRHTLDTLPAGNYDAYALEPVGIEAHRLGSAVIWDTPDFDSVDADAYRASVLRTIALADVILLVVSKDKYADQSVWESMRALEPLGQPTVVCLNKVPVESTATLIRSLEEKWRGVRGDTPAPILVLPYVDDWDQGCPAALEKKADQLRELVSKGIVRMERGRHRERASALVRLHWPDWTAPIRIEHDALAEWRQLVESATAGALTIYERDFLDRPQHYETFQRALAELLTLLEIPGVARAFLTARTVVTWPVRQLTRLGKSLSGHKGDISQEITVLQQATDHLLVHLNETVLEKSETSGEMRAWWRDIAQVLRRDRRIQGEQCHAAIAAYHRAFQPEIESTARQLYERLREHPAILNSLRATRVTTDAAALAVALHTGGIGVHDFILAPAILSITTLLAEGALGHYLKRAEVELKQRQRQAVSELLNRQLGANLLRLPERLESADRFNVPAEALQAAEALIAPHA